MPHPKRGSGVIPRARLQPAVRLRARAPKQETLQGSGRRMITEGSWGISQTKAAMNLSSHSISDIHRSVLVVSLAGHRLPERREALTEANHQTFAE